MDNLIDSECVSLKFNLDFALIKFFFERDTNNTDEVVDEHVFDTLSSILDFQKFKEMMLVFKNKEERTTNLVVNASVGNWDV